MKRIDREFGTLLNLILKGGYVERINAKMVQLEARKAEWSARSPTRRSLRRCLTPTWRPSAVSR